jgi:rod shape-determining protein MreD
MDTEWHDTLLKTLGRWGLVLGMLALVMALSAVPFHIPHLGAARPAFLLMAVYYWTILRPPPLLGVFALGLVLDLLSNFPLGMSAGVLVAAQALTAHNRKFLLGQSFRVIWAGFALVALGAGLIQWGLFSLFSLDLVPVKPVLAGALLSALLFPLLVWPLAAVYKALTDRPADVP